MWEVTVSLFVYSLVYSLSWLFVNLLSPFAPPYRADCNLSYIDSVEYVLESSPQIYCT